MYIEKFYSVITLAVETMVELHQILTVMVRYFSVSGGAQIHLALGRPNNCPTTSGVSLVSRKVVTSTLRAPIPRGLVHRLISRETSKVANYHQVCEARYLLVLTEHTSEAMLNVAYLTQIFLFIYACSSLQTFEKEKCRNIKQKETLDIYISKNIKSN